MCIIVNFVEPRFDIKKISFNDPTTLESKKNRSVFDPSNILGKFYV